MGVQEEKRKEEESEKEGVKRREGWGGDVSGKEDGTKGERRRVKKRREKQEGRGKKKT